MGYKRFTGIGIALCLFCLCYADSFYADRREEWLRIAEENTPELLREEVVPASVVEVVADPAAFQGYRTEECGLPAAIYGIPLQNASSVIVDFGRHLTGTFSCTLNHHGRVSDAPVRLKFTFVEVPSELAASPDPWPGTLSRGWFQGEIVTVESVPATITIPRRMAFRYVKMEVLGRSPYFDFSLSSATCIATTSTVSTPEPLPASASPLIHRIDEVGLYTLRECMQTVYEDGSKRDRRLWISDLYLEVLANNYSYGNHGLTRRCLYLLAALSREDGVLHATVFEKPESHPQYGTVFLDYALLWNLTLCEYYKVTGDKSTVTDLWPVFLRQVEYALEQVDEDGLYDPSSPCWLFFDWKDKLDKQTAIQGLLIYTLREAKLLARRIGLEQRVGEYEEIIHRLSDAVLRKNYDSRTGFFLSGPSRQLSWISQVWMVLADVVTPRKG